MEKAPETVQLNEEQFGALRERLEKNQLTAEDRRLIVQIFQAMRWLTQQLELGRLSMHRLKRLIFGEKTESRENIFKGTEKGPNKSGSKCWTESSDENKPKKPGHGRRGADEYTGAEKIFCPHPNLKAGSPCPDCGKGYLHAAVEKGIFIRFVGNPPISATIYETEKLRCGLCGKVFEAPLPSDVKAERWDESAKSVCALSRYGYGVPHYRLEKWQADLGVPVSDSVAFSLSNDVADCGFAVYRLLVQMGAQGSLIHYDDTGIKILDLIQENKTRDPTKERVGMFTTAVISETSGKEIALFFSGRNHAGENIVKLLEKRVAGLDPPLLMSDGSSRNPPTKEFEAILLNCLTHGRRHFVDLMESFPQEIKYVIDTLALVYHNDALSKNMGAEQRLRFHQKNSGPLMDELKAWCRSQIENKKAEPNSGLGKAIKYMEKRWEKLTQFLKIPGAPLSNDIAERLIKRCVLHRKNSLFFWTEHGAAVGDILMSLIHTTVRTKENPFHYLTALQRHRSEVKQNPQAWLPWTYRATLKSLLPSHEKGI